MRWKILGSKDSKILSKRADIVLNKTGALLSHGVVAIAVVILLGLTDIVTFDYPIAVAFIGIVSVALTVFQFFNILNFNYRTLAVIAINHAIAATFILFMAPVNSILFFVWLITIFRTDYFYGRNGSLASLAIATVVAYATLFFRLDTIQSEDIVLTTAMLLILAAISLLITSIRDISDKERRVLVVSMDKAQLERQRLLSLINSMGDAVIATDEDGTIRLYNGATLDILDTNESLENQKVQKFLNLYDEAGKAIDIVKSVQRDGTNIRRSDLVIRFSNQDKMNLYLSVAPIKLGFRSNSERGFIMILRDITKEKSLEEERDEFISVVSHELRTPITISEAEISNAQLLNDRQVKNDKIGKALESAHKQVVFLANMTNDLATLSRAQREALDVELEIIDPKEILEKLKSSYAIEAQQKGLVLHTQVEGTVRTVVSSRLYVDEILQNFVTNALKYTRSGSITVIASQGDGGIQFTISDTGIGISKADQKKLFNKFFRSEDYRTRESNGTGLGLYVTLKLAKRLGAKITVSSEIDKGSSFGLFVPSAQKEQKKHEVTESDIGKFIDQV